jgi:hypothetical protein
MGATLARIPGLASRSGQATFPPASTTWLGAEYINIKRPHWPGSRGWPAGRARPPSLQPLPPDWVQSIIVNSLNRVHWPGDGGLLVGVAWIAGRAKPPSLSC